MLDQMIEPETRTTFLERASRLVMILRPTENAAYFLSLGKIQTTLNTLMSNGLLAVTSPLQ
jgi:hypothetical protein